MQTVGHRGASALAPENTVLAIRLAIDYRLDFVEVDVHLSRDGELVVHHDPALVDEHGVRTPVSELTVAELSRVSRADDQVVPTLAEVFAVASGRIGVYVELKGPGTGEALGALLRRSAGPPEVISGSFLPELVAELRRAAPDVPRSILFHRVLPTTMLETCLAHEARYAHPCARPIEPATIATLHAAGLLVMTPHTNSPAEAERFRRAGADLVASDDPRLLVALSRRAGEEQPS
ncbi:MAG: glycerophosphodiester phosphodiesterase [Candidatus Limnocylindrales bacterium]